MLFYLYGCPGGGCQRFSRAALIAGATVMAVTSAEAVRAAAFVYAPPAVTETNSLSDFFDDDVDVSGGAQPGGIAMAAGDTITWSYTYTQGGPAYEVLSSDLADIEDLHLYGATLGGGPVSDVMLRLNTCDGFLPAIMWKGLGWGANNLLVSSEDDKLGNLQGEIITGFEVQMTLTAGNVNFTSIDFLWEADDIEKGSCDIPEPHSLLMLLSLGGFVARRWRPSN